MTAFQHSNFNIQVAQDYFAQLNPLAGRIASDIRVTKAAYGQLWYTLKPSEQNDILNDTLIKPEISLKYFDKFSSSVHSLPSNSTSSSTTLYSGGESANSGEHILPNLPKNKEHKNSNLDTVVTSTSSLRDSFLKQTQSLLPVASIARSHHATSVQPHGKLKPPSSPPPPPPICVAKPPIKQTDAKSSSAIQNKSRSEHTNLTNELKSYAFDGRNLCTYAAQKVALKIIYDDVLGAYRDEHSWPFSYCTSSQINLQQHHKEANFGDITHKAASDEVCLFQSSPNTKNIDTTKSYEQFHEELRNTLGKPRNEKSIKISSVNNIIYKRLYGCKDKGPADNASKHPTSISQPKIVPVHVNQVTFMQKVNPCRNERSNLSNGKDTANVSCLLASAPKQQHMPYAVYTDGYLEVGESATLMSNSGNNQTMNASSNSSTTSEEDHNNYEYDDEKALCEDIRLLKNDLNLRKEFDFLNNW